MQRSQNEKMKAAGWRKEQRSLLLMKEHVKDKGKCITFIPLYTGSCDEITGIMDRCEAMIEVGLKIQRMMLEGRSGGELVEMSFIESIAPNNNLWAGHLYPIQALNDSLNNCLRCLNTQVLLRQTF